MQLSNSETRPRELKSSAAWLWADKSVVRRIREAFDELPFLDQALAVYFTLCELSSDHENSSFTVRKRVIAERSGVSLRRVTEVLKILKSLDVVTWTQNASEGTKGLRASTYVLLASGTARPTPGTVSSTSRTENPTLGRNAKRDSCRDIEEKREENNEETLEQRTDVKFRRPSLQKVKLQAILIRLPQYEAINFYLHHQANGWRVDGVKMTNWIAALAYWKFVWDERQSKENTGTNQIPEALEIPRP